MPHEFKEHEEIEQIESEGAKILEPSLPKHEHTGSDVPRISLKNLSNMIEVVATMPSDSPNNVYNQLKLVVAGGLATLAVYDQDNTVWRQIAFTE